MYTLKEINMKLLFYLSCFCYWIMQLVLEISWQDNIIMCHIGAHIWKTGDFYFPPRQRPGREILKRPPVCLSIMFRTVTVRAVWERLEPTDSSTRPQRQSWSCVYLWRLTWNRTGGAGMARSIRGRPIWMLSTPVRKRSADTNPPNGAKSKWPRHGLPLPRFTRVLVTLLFLGGLRVTNPTIRLVCPSVSVRLSVRLSVCPSVCLSVNISLVNTITQQILGALIRNLYHGCISGVSWLSSKMDDLDLFLRSRGSI